MKEKSKKDTPIYIKPEDRERFILISQILGKDRRDTFTELVDNFVKYKKDLANKASEKLNNNL